MFVWEMMDFRGIIVDGLSDGFAIDNILALWSNIFIQLIWQRSVFDLGIELRFSIMRL